MTDDNTSGEFSSWYNEGSPIPVAHPLPHVYAEVYFSGPDTVEWRLYDFKEDTATVETFTFESSTTGDLPDAMR